MHYHTPAPATLLPPARAHSSSLLLHFDAILENEYFKPADQLAEALSIGNLLGEDRVITYCGGGIAATIDAFACLLMGQHNVSVYDGSMSEWVQSDERPLTLGDQPLAF